MVVALLALALPCVWTSSADAREFDPETSILFDIRLGGGATADMLSGEVAGLVNLDVMLRASLTDDPDAPMDELLLPELGFSYSAFKGSERYVFRAGVGYGAAWGLFMVGVVPSLVIGAEHRQEGAGFGVRVTGIAELIWIAGLSVSYQMMAVGGRATHELQVGASINLLPVLLLAD